ncbi:MAG TPA: rhodanese-like domain-containing protein [Thermoanaerobaculia bacterium]|nr:rhodanese-like domain-containing protein [Thermoanaerobaculia bacterium]
MKSIIRFVFELTALVVAAALCALVANGLAARERKLALIGSYPNALSVPDRRGSEPAPSQAAMVPAATTTVPDIDVIEDSVQAEQSAEAGAAEPGETSTVAPARPSESIPAVPAPQAKIDRRQLMLERFSPRPETPYVEISGEDAGWLHAQGALFLDARRTSIYEQGHIAGARNFAVWESDVDDKVMALAGEIPDADRETLPVVIYCSGGACEDSHMLAQKLFGLFFNNILVYKDGYPDWQSRGGAVRTGARP